MCMASFLCCIVFVLVINKQSKFLFRALEKPEAYILVDTVLKTSQAFLTYSMLIVWCHVIKPSDFHWPTERDGPPDFFRYFIQMYFWHLKLKIDVPHGFENVGNGACAGEIFCALSMNVVLCKLFPGEACHKDSILSKVLAIFPITINSFFL